MISKLFKFQQKTVLSTLKKSFATSLQQESLNQDLSQKDPVIYDIIQQEQLRQKQGINLIASENHCSKAVLNALGTPLIGQFSSGQVGNRWHPGTRQIDEIESLCMERALKAFNLNPEEWGVNVQAYSGCHANFYVFGALLQTHQRILGLDLPHGGHLSHGFQVKGKKISMVSQFFDSYPYKLNEETGIINYEQMQQIAESYHPQIIIAGTSAYSRLIDYKKFKEVADNVGAYLLADMCHISGLVAAGVVPSPFEYADIVTTTTHKSLRGPRGSLIFYRKGVRSVDKKGKKTMYNLEEPINYSVSPMHQNSAINNSVAAVAVALKQANSSFFKEYQQQVLKNSSSYAKKMMDLGYTLVSGGTDNHLSLVNLKASGLDGSRAEKLLDILKIYGNKNTVPGDKSALNPGGYRVGSPAMTTRGLVEKDFDEVALFMDKAFKLIPKLKKDCGGKKIVDFTNYIQQNQQNIPEISNLQKEVQAFAEQFPVPSLD